MTVELWHVGHINSYRYVWVVGHAKSDRYVLVVWHVNSDCYVWVSLLVSWCFEPSQPQRDTSELTLCLNCWYTMTLSPRLCTAVVLIFWWSHGKCRLSTWCPYIHTCARTGHGSVAVDLTISLTICYSSSRAEYRGRETPESSVQGIESHQSFAPRSRLGHLALLASPTAKNPA